jgi:hypothetical protein
MGSIFAPYFTHSNCVGFVWLANRRPLQGKAAKKTANLILPRVRPEAVGSMVRPGTGAHRHRPGPHNSASTRIKCQPGSLVQGYSFPLCEGGEPGRLAGP